jgi:hypothetical protein
MVGRLVNNELEGIWKEAIMGYSMYYAGISLEGLANIAETLCQDTWGPSRGSNQALL